jgi:hypothetical protein
MPILFRQAQLLEMTEAVPIRGADDNHLRRIRFPYGAKEPRKDGLPSFVGQLIHRLIQQFEIKAIRVAVIVPHNLLHRLASRSKCSSGSLYISS